MNKQETGRILATIKNAYPSSFRDADPEAAGDLINMWQRIFAEIPYDIMGAALKRIIMREKFAPTIAEMADELKRMGREADDGLDILLGAARDGLPVAQRRIQELRYIAGSVSAAGLGSGTRETGRRLPDRDEIAAMAALCAV